MRFTSVLALAFIALGCQSQREQAHDRPHGENGGEHGEEHGGEEEHISRKEVHDELADHDETPADPDPLENPWAGAHRGTSAAGNYDLRWRATTGEIPLNEGFGLEVWVFEPGGSQPLENVRLRVDAAMPGHGHGMNRVPEVTRGEGGRFLVDGLLFHMTGMWALYLDVGRGAVTERAEFEIELE